MEYIHQLHEQPGGGKPLSGCFLCDYIARPDDDPANHVIWRTDRCLTLFNRFPYTNGHLLIAPKQHVAELSDLDEAVLTDLMRQVRDAQRLLKETVTPQGFNVGMNFGRCAGAGLPDHLHIHIVPRWSGDTNFMPVIADVRVIPQSIEALHALMREAAPKLNLPSVR
jgi:ATP adenylyltransferase